MKNQPSLASEFVVFLREEKTWWLTPLFASLAVLSLVVVAAESSAIAPFVYSIF